MVLSIADLDFETRITCNRAKGVERSDGRIEPQFIGVHVAGGTTDNANECLEIVVILEIVVLRDYSPDTVEETDVEDGGAERDVERITHERASSKMETSDIRNLA